MVLRSLLLPVLLLAQEPPRQPEFVYFTELGDEVLARSDAVILGEIASVARLRGTDVVRVAVSRAFLGAAVADSAEVTVLAPPGDFFAGSEHLLFLDRFEGGPRYSVRNRVSRHDPDWDAKLACLERNLALREIAPVEDRRRAVRKLLWDGADAADEWTRWHTLRELRWLRGRHPDLVTREDRDDLARLAARSADERFRDALLALLLDWDR